MGTKWAKIIETEEGLKRYCKHCDTFHPCPDRGESNEFWRWVPSRGSKGLWVCRAYEKSRRHDHYMRNREKVRDQVKAYREANQEKVAQYQREYYEKNKEAILARTAEYRRRNKALYAKAQERFRNRHPDLMKRYYIENKDAHNLRARLRRERKATNRDNVWTKEMDEALKTLQPSCVVCGRSDVLHVDHVIPVVAGGRLEPGNAVVLCERCNKSKGAKPLEELPPAMRQAIEKAAQEFLVHWESVAHYKPL